MEDCLSKVVEAVSEILANAVCGEEKFVDRMNGVDARLKEALREIGRRAVETIYEKAVAIVAEESKEKGLQVQRRSKVIFHTIFGAIDVESTYLWNSKTHETARPAKTKLNVTHHGRSQAVERALTDFGAEESFGNAAKRIHEHYGFEIDRTSVLRVVESIAEEAEAYVDNKLKEARKEFEKPTLQRRGVERILVEFDGGEIRTGKLVAAPELGKTEVYKNEKRRRDTAWRDVRMGLARPLDELQPTYVGKLASYPEVIGQLFDASCLRGLSQDTKVIACTDGGNGIREEIETQFSNVQYVLDRCHMKSHLYETADAMGLEETPRENWVALQMARLHEGDVQLVLDSLSTHKGRGKHSAETLHGYLTRFKDAVSYDAFSKDGLPIGSGEIESAHRSIPQKRLKLPGAWWNESTINPMLNLRILRANDWWDDFWAQRAA